MRLLVALVPLLACSCAAGTMHTVVIARGGSATDIDRDTDSAWSRDSGSIQGGMDSIGSLGTEQTRTVPYAALPPPGGGPSDVRRLQEQLARLGYYQGPITGHDDAATEDALARYRQDSGRPIEYQEAGAPRPRL
jgi:hypothetical protein